MTVTAGSTLSVSSIDSTIAADSSARPPVVCSYHNPLLPQLEAIHPRLQCVMSSRNRRARPPCLRAPTAPSRSPSSPMHQPCRDIHLVGTMCTRPARPSPMV